MGFTKYRRLVGAWGYLNIKKLIGRVYRKKFGHIIGNFCFKINPFQTSEAWNLFKSKLDIAMRKFIPLKNVKFRHQPPWFDSEIFEMSKIKNNLRKTFKYTGSLTDQENYTRYKNKFKQKVMDKKRDFITADPCDTHDNNTINKKFWSFVKSNTKCGRIPDVIHYSIIKGDTDLTDLINVNFLTSTFVISFLKLAFIMLTLI